jgi:hypothetical protein
MSFRSAVTESGIRIYNDVGKGRIKRLHLHDSLLKIALEYNVTSLGWKNCINRVITRPKYVDGKIYLGDGFYDNNLFRFDEKTEDVNLDDIIGGYEFISERSRTYAIIAMIAAFGTHFGDGGSRPFIAMP